MRNKILLLVVVLVIGINTSVLALDLGYIHTGNLSGISLRKSEGVFRPQFIGHLSSSNGSFYVESGLRGLYSLGQAGVVDRYVGAGVSYLYNGKAMEPYAGYGGQVFVGVDFPLGTTPFQLSVEVGIVGTKMDHRDITINNNVGAGVHYRF